MDRNNCSQHVGQNISFLCLQEECDQNRLVCQLCLLQFHKKHMKSCVTLKNLYSNDINAWSEKDKELSQFKNMKWNFTQSLNEQFDIIDSNMKTNFTQARKEALVKYTKIESSFDKEFQQFTWKLQTVFSLEKISGYLQDFNNGKLSHEELNGYINNIIDAKDQLIQTYDYGGLEFSESCIDTKYLHKKQKQIEDALNQLKYILKFRSEDIKFILSSKFQTKKQLGKQYELEQGFFSFKLNETCLIYSNRRFKSGVHCWNLLIEIPHQDKLQEEQQQQQGLEQIIQNPGLGISNSGIFSAAEYKKLTRLYVGIIDDRVKDNDKIFDPSTNGCHLISALDIIRGQSLGGLQAKPTVPGQAINLVHVTFQSKLQGGFKLTMNLDFNTQKFQIRDSENKIFYEQHLGLLTQSSQVWRPFVFSLKSSINVRVIN